MNVISLFDYTTNMVQPWAEAGYTCYCVDIQHPEGETREGNIIKVGADIMTWEPPQTDIAILFAFIPCTDVALSGARWFREKGLKALHNTLGLWVRVLEIVERLNCPYLIENPMSTIASYYRKPDAKIHPWMWGDLWTKETWLWVGGGFQVPLPAFTRAPQGTTNKIHLMPPSEDRANKRSETPMGFARAVFEANATVSPLA
jgi:hypothetical protein